MQMSAIPEEVLRLLQDLEVFLVDFLAHEKLSDRAWQRRDALLLGFWQMKERYSSEFPLKGAEATNLYATQDSSDDGGRLQCAMSVVSDDVSFSSDINDFDAEEISQKGAHELENVVQQGYLEKKCRDHSFFGSEWQKRWCVLSKGIFYYYSSEKGKQYKGAFHIKDYVLQPAPHLRKDLRRDSCFELASCDKRIYQFTAASPVEAKEWMDHIAFLLKDLNSFTIPYDEEKTYDDVDTLDPLQQPDRSLVNSADQEERVHDEDIYEVLPDEVAYDYSSYYQCLWDCDGDYTDELSFQRGDFIHVLSKEYNNHGWWVGELHGEIGIVPKDYLMPAYELESI